MALRIATAENSTNTVTFTDGSAFDFTGSFTWCGWVYPIVVSNTKDPYFLWRYNGAVTQGYRGAMLNGPGTGLFGLESNAPNWAPALTPNDPTVDNWFFMAWRYKSPATSTVYISWIAPTATAFTTVSSTAGVSTAITSNVSTLNMGNSAGGTDSFNGRLDHVRMYSTDLTDAQLLNLRWQPAGVNEFPNCVGAWRWDATATLADYKQGGNGTATVNGIEDGPPVRG